MVKEYSLDQEKSSLFACKVISERATVCQNSENVLIFSTKVLKNGIIEDQEAKDDSDIVNDGKMLCELEEDEAGNEEDTEKPTFRKNRIRYSNFCFL